MTVIDFVEARKTRRRQVLYTGLIRFGDMSICCVVRNLSKAGAALDIGSHIGIPDQFTLIVVPQKKIYSCGVGSVGIQDSHPGLVVIQAVDGPIRFD
jgi:hypothetical protein